MTTEEETDVVLIHLFEVAWKFITGLLVFFMQPGFAMLEAGVVQRKNIKNILTKNIVDTCCAATIFWLWGYAFAFGCKDKVCNPFIGNANFAFSEFGDPNVAGYINWFFQFTFITVSVTIVSGSVAERIQFRCYCVYASVMAGLIYPIVAHWVWGGGWLFENGVIDFAGCAAVHMVGGGAGLVATTIMGPRTGRFEGTRFHVTVNEFPSFSSVFSALGVLFLWFGWYGFNCGSVSQYLGQENVVELIILNTTLAPVGSTLIGLLLKTALNDFKKIDLDSLLNCCIAGLVSITASCSVVEPGYGFLIGCIGAVFYIGCSALLKQLKIDDPLDAAPLHFGCGIWGLFATGLFAHPDHVRAAYALDTYHVYAGAFYEGNDRGHLLAWQIVTIIAVTLWTCTTSFILFYTCHKLNFLRVDGQTELVGLDQRLHGGAENRSVILDAAASQVAQNQAMRAAQQQNQFRPIAE
eukprot:c16547_g1_i3.p1 GENE.c16547_g1_i3~~c16547_g1_i3.p1  ORF type:complete len:488 (+),score=165.43 c16547_g1_i3:67-1464(+)